MNIDKIGSNIINSGVKSVNEHITPCISNIRQSVKGINIDDLRYAPHKADIVKLNEKIKFEKSLRANFVPEPVRISCNGGDETVWSRFKYSQMGSQDAFWAKNESNGELFYVKYAQDTTKEGHIESEILASNLYRLAGIDTPEIIPVTTNGKIKGLASKYVTELKSATDKSQLYDGFAADAWLANWDSLVTGNTFIRNGRPFKVDNGGALRYRAQGDLKPNFGDKVDELITLINGRNYDSTNIYSSMSQNDLIKSFEKVCNIQDDAILRTVSDKELAQTLINRKNYMCDVLAEIKKTPKTEPDLKSYLTRITQNIAEKSVFNPEKLTEILSEKLNSAIVENTSDIIIPPSKSIINNLINELKEMENQGVKISKDDITSFLRETAQEGLDITAPQNRKHLNKLCSMEEFYTRMFTNLSIIAEKTPIKDGETASAFVKRLVKIRDRKLKQLENLRIKTIKSKLKYEPDIPVKPRKLTEEERTKAIKELETLRCQHIACGIGDVHPKLTEKSSDAAIHRAWQHAHLGNFEFSTDRLQNAVMQVGHRYDSTRNIKTKCGGGQDSIAKDYIQEFEFEPVYHWLGKNDAEKFVMQQLPKTGEIYTVPTRQCCSTHKEYAEFDYGDHIPNMNIKFIMHPKSKTSRAITTGYNHEVVYPAGEQFRILDKECIECIDPNTGSAYLRWEVHMQEV